jgi:PEP-CTERM motif
VAYAKIHSYWVNGYNLNNPANIYFGTGFGDWNGRGGISSSTAITSYANNQQISVGVYDGQFAVANGFGMGPGAIEDFSFTGGQELSPNLPQNKLLIRPTLTTDLNGDGKSDAYDINILNSFYGFYGPGRPGGVTNLGIMVGDLNGDGAVDATDVTIFNTAYAGAGATYNAATGKVTPGASASAKSASTPTLTGNGVASATSSGSASPASTTLAATGTLAFSYDQATGDVKVVYNGFTGLAGKPAMGTTSSNGLSTINLNSLALNGDGLIPANVSSTAIGILGQPTKTGGGAATSNQILMSAALAVTPDGTDFGNILLPGLTQDQLLSDLTLKFNYTGSGSPGGGTAGLIFLGVPEPTTISLLGLAALGLMSRRRKNKVGAAR